MATQRTATDVRQRPVRVKATMPSYSPNPFTLDEAHAAAAFAGLKPTQLGNRGRFSFNSRACHLCGDNPNGCWAREVDGRVYFHFHCHKHGGAKSERREAQRRITANLGLPELRVPRPSNENGQPYQTREWTYRNPTTGETAVQMVERYDGACWHDDCHDRFAHKHPWLWRDEKFQGAAHRRFFAAGTLPVVLKLHRKRRFRFCPGGESVHFAHQNGCSK